jgi:hypothetical protein
MHSWFIQILTCHNLSWILFELIDSYIFFLKYELKIDSLGNSSTRL